MVRLPRVRAADRGFRRGADPDANVGSVPQRFSFGIETDVVALDFVPRAGRGFFEAAEAEQVDPSLREEGAGEDVAAEVARIGFGAVRADVGADRVFSGGDRDGGTAADVAAHHQVDFVFAQRRPVRADAKVVALDGRLAGPDQGQAAAVVVGEDVAGGGGDATDRRFVGPGFEHDPVEVVRGRAAVERDPDPVAAGGEPVGFDDPDRGQRTGNCQAFDRDVVGEDFQPVRPFEAHARPFLPGIGFARFAAVDRHLVFDRREVDEKLVDRVSGHFTVEGGAEVDRVPHRGRFVREFDRRPQGARFRDPAVEAHPFFFV